LIELYGTVFDWDENKDIENIRKHGVSFRDAATVFEDKNALYSHDIKHSQHEERFNVIGYGKNPNLLVVCHCYRESNTVIRIISARKATNNEKILYGRAL